MLADDYIVIVAGFQGQTPEGETTTLGRGGSDLTAIALAGALNADACQIFTDVDGVFTCDPRIVADAKKLDEVAYDELLEMAGAGSKVMQSRAVEFAKKFGVEFEVRSSFKSDVGTIAKEETANMEDVVIRGISVDRNQAKVTIDDVRDEPGIAGADFLRDRGRQHHCRHDCAKRLRARNDRHLLYDPRKRPGLGDGVADAGGKGSPGRGIDHQERRRQAERGRDRDAVALRAWPRGCSIAWARAESTFS